MATDPDRVIVENNVCTHCGVHATRVHHHNFPEIQAEGGSVAEGVLCLKNHLFLCRESAETGWHRELISEALADVAALLNSLSENVAGNEAACRCEARVTVTAVSPLSPSKSTETR